jgi:hypothetical protein
MTILGYKGEPSTGTNYNLVGLGIGTRFPIIVVIIPSLGEICMRQHSKASL